ncbi:hypothetical protein KI387_029666, partial [Taxus chinensis]
KKCETLVAAQESHKSRREEIGKLIVQKMDLLERIITSMSNVVLVLQNEKGEIARDELESITLDILEKVEQ